MAHVTEYDVTVSDSLFSVLFNDTWSLQGHMLLCITILYFMFANHQIRHIEPQAKWAVSLVIANGHLNLPWTEQELTSLCTPYCAMLCVCVHA